ncbi:MAG TPA: outer membrane lipoprotein-sorting protein [Candidatus Sulfopaludibacter sp.]|nr:outer membrane lipoprotein-sorting protein [Candidatus Sulfopaludibacter sp.]
MDRAIKIFAVGTFASILLVASDATAKMTNDSAEAVILGRQLAQRILEQRPVENFTNVGVLKISDANGKTSEIPVECVVITAATNWSVVYKAFFTNFMETLTVIHPDHQLFRQLMAPGLPHDQPKSPDDLPKIAGTINDRIEPFDACQHEGYPGSPDLAAARLRSASFADSDFSVDDLCLEFLHWPDQKILKPYEMRRGRSCKVLESTNPNPTANGYSRVVSWIDNETLGIVQAEAYDAKGNLLKEFYPKSFKKVNGQWELQEMEIRNDQTGSRTRLEFNSRQPD